jgi:hypothetical protein
MSSLSAVQEFPITVCFSISEGSAETYFYEALLKIAHTPIPYGRTTFTSVRPSNWEKKSTCSVTCLVAPGKNRHRPERQYLRVQRTPSAYHSYSPAVIIRSFKASMIRLAVRSETNVVVCRNFVAISNPMKTLTTVCLVLSLVITSYCLLEYELPDAQYTKVLSDLNSSRIKDYALIERVRWSIVGVKTTWPPLIIAALCQNALLVILLAKLATGHRPKTQDSALGTQH